MRKGDHPDDPRGLICEAYKIEGISEQDCRTIFLDWLIGSPTGTDPEKLIRAVHEHYSTLHPEHPMTKVLAEGLERHDHASIGKRGRFSHRRK